ncbi:MAG: hypothetical protein AAF387_15105 [Pseudomonadota bacterium]
MKKMKETLFTALVLLLAPLSFARDDLPQPAERDPVPVLSEFKVLKFFPGKNGLLVGRFKLVNQSTEIISFHGRPSSMMEIIALSPTQDVPAYTTYVRLNESEPNKWIKVPSPQSTKPEKTQLYELYPSEVRYLDLSLPNAKDKPEAELAVQLLIMLGDSKYFIDSDPFKLN